MRFIFLHLDSHKQKKKKKKKKKKSPQLWDVRAADMSVRLFLPHCHSVYDNLEDDDTRMAHFDDFRMNAKYSYHLGFDPSVSDSFLMTLKLDRPQVIMYGFFLRFFGNFMDNYFGYSICTVRLEEWLRSGMRGNPRTERLFTDYYVDEGGALREVNAMESHLDVAANDLEITIPQLRGEETGGHDHSVDVRAVAVPFLLLRCALCCARVGLCCARVGLCAFRCTRGFGFVEILF
jgi:hypothetical protein